MYKQLEKMEQAVSRYKDRRDNDRDFSFDISEFMKASLIAIRRTNKAVLDLQLNQCGSCSWKKQYLESLDKLNMEDLLIIQSKTNKIILKRVRGEI